MSERQKNGFNIENRIIEEYGFTKSENYTAIYDAVSKTGINVQIKSFKNKTSVCMGDLKRNFNKEEPFILIFYNYDSNYNCIKTYAFIVRDYKKYNEMFYFEQYNDFYYEFMNNISNDPKDDKVWKALSKKYKTEYNKVHSMTRMNPKRDHKHQKRIQCSIPYKFIDSFVREFEELTEIELKTI